MEEILLGRITTPEDTENIRSVISLTFVFLNQEQLNVMIAVYEKCIGPSCLSTAGRALHAGAGDMYRCIRSIIHEVYRTLLESKAVG